MYLPRKSNVSSVTARKPSSILLIFPPAICSVPWIICPGRTIDPTSVEDMLNLFPPLPFHRRNYFRDKLPFLVHTDTDIFLPRRVQLRIIRPVMRSSTLLPCQGSHDDYFCRLQHILYFQTGLR